MTPRVITYNGNRDGIRFGWLTFGQAKRCYMFDRINGSVTLYIEAAGGEPLVDDDPGRMHQALAALTDHDPL